jgi:hypothetical protein
MEDAEHHSVLENIMPSLGRTLQKPSYSNQSSDEDCYATRSPEKDFTSAKKEQQLDNSRQ